MFSSCSFCCFPFTNYIFVVILSKYLIPHMFLHSLFALFCFREIALNKYVLEDMGVTHVVNCAQGSDPGDVNTDARYYKVWCYSDDKSRNGNWIVKYMNDESKNYYHTFKDYRYHAFPHTEFSYFMTIDTRQYELSNCLLKIGGVQVIKRPLWHHMSWRRFPLNG